MYVDLNNIKYRICSHAEKRMKERGIKKEDIQCCLDNHQVEFNPSKGYSLYITDHPNGKRLQVTINKENKEVVSVVWLV
jgi:hypothetical protein